MKFYNLNGKSVAKNVEKFRIDWEHKSKSKFQFGVKQFLKEFWKNDVCYEEMVLAGTRLSLDIVNMTHKIAIECHGVQHSEFVKHFHGHKINFLSQCDRDQKKKIWCENNSITLVEVYPRDVPLTKEWFKEKYGVILL